MSAADGLSYDYETLGLPEGASSEEVKEAYRDLAKIWHPDRFGANEIRLKAKAEEKLKEINAAYARIQEFHSQYRPSPSDNPSYSSVCSSPEEPFAPVEATECSAGQGSQRWPSEQMVPASRGPTFWRLAKVLLRAIWRLFKLSALVAIAGLLILAVVLRLLEHFSDGESDNGSLRSWLRAHMLRLYVADLLGVPLVAAQGLLFGLLLAVLLVGGVFAFIGSSLAPHPIVLLVICCGIALAIVFWALSREYAIEFRSATTRANGTLGWVMGLLILISSAVAGAYMYPMSSNNSTASPPVPENSSAATVQSSAASPEVSSTQDASSSNEESSTNLADTLKNMTYVFHHGSTVENSIATIKMVNGKAESDSVSYDVGRVAVGDLNGDGEADAVAVIGESGGGSGYFEGLVAAINKNGTITNSEIFDLGDRVRINSLEINGGIITVDMLTQGPHDGMCCPTKHRVVKLQLQGAELVELRAAEEAIAAPAETSDSAQSVVSSTPQSADEQPIPQTALNSSISQQGGVITGHIISKIDPIYPPIARAAHVGGTVVLHAVIGKDGSISSLSVVSGPPMLVGAATDAVRQWKYEPYLLNGSPVEVDTTISVNFDGGTQ